MQSMESKVLNFCYVKKKMISSLNFQTKFVIWAGCSSDNGTGYMIETHARDSSTVQFRCVCSGVVDSGNTRRFCHLHVITCPRNS